MSTKSAVVVLKVFLYQYTVRTPSQIRNAVWTGFLVSGIMFYYKVGVLCCSSFYCNSLSFRCHVPGMSENLPEGTRYPCIGTSIHTGFIANCRTYWYILQHTTHCTCLVASDHTALRPSTLPLVTWRLLFCLECGA